VARKAVRVMATRQPLSCKEIAQGRPRAGPHDGCKVASLMNQRNETAQRQGTDQSARTPRQRKSCTGPYVSCQGQGSFT
jgi:hypothetical protein